MLQASLIKNDRKASWLIAIFSFVVFAAVVTLGMVHLHVQLPFDVHIFALFNAVVNATVAILLVAALFAVKNGKYLLHKQLMIAALVLSVAFLVSYVTHKLFAGEARFGDANRDGILSDTEKAAVGGIRMIYFIILSTHIFLAAIIMPFVLFTAYRALIAEWPAHKKIARYTWPLWFYVAVTGPIVYIMISPYYR
jgi:putative membrane protein